MPSGSASRRAGTGTLFDDTEMLRAAANSLIIALGAATLATVLGTMAGIAMQRWRYGSTALPAFSGADAGGDARDSARRVAAAVLPPGARPDARPRLDPHRAHHFLDRFRRDHRPCSSGGLDESIFEAARDLGASPWQTFRRVTLPLILPAVLAGFLMSFTLSIDDFVITFFVAGVGVTTLPLQIYSMIKVAVTPEVNAVSTLLMALTLTLIALAARLAPDALKGRA
jgi:spermidine/putrescine transport system permease protein